MAEATNQRKAGTGRSALGIGVIVAMAAVICAALVYALSRPGVLESVVNIVIIAAVVIGAAVVIIYVAMAVLAVPMYAYKGETYQENVDYSLEDVEPVKEKEDPEDGPKF